MVGGVIQLFRLDHREVVEMFNKLYLIDFLKYNADRSPTMMSSWSIALASNLQSLTYRAFVQNATR